VEPSIPEALEAIVVRALATDPKARFATANDLRVALETWLGQQAEIVTPRQVAELVQSLVGREIEQRKHEVRTASAHFSSVSIENLPRTAGLDEGPSSKSGARLSVEASIAVAIEDATRAEGSRSKIENARKANADAASPHGAPEAGSGGMGLPSVATGPTKKSAVGDGLGALSPRSESGTSRAEANASGSHARGQRDRSNGERERARPSGQGGVAWAGPALIALAVVIAAALVLVALR
jgi:hypothetical protein